MSIFDLLSVYQGRLGAVAFVFEGVGRHKAYLSSPHAPKAAVPANADGGVQSLGLSGFRATYRRKELIDAFVCLMDDGVAEKVYVYIHKCARPQIGTFALRSLGVPR